MSGQPLRFGKQVVMTREGDLTMVHEEVYANFDTVKKITVYTETVRIKDDKDILAEFLKLLDRQKAGEIDLIGLQCLRNPDSGAMRIEKSWVVPDLR